MRVSMIALLIVILLAAASTASNAEERLVVVSSFTIIHDLVDQVAEDRIDHRVIVPVNAEVHEWELVPQNFVDLEEADLLFYNGLELEEWLPQATAVLSPDSRKVSLAEAIEAEYRPIEIGEQKGDIDPHLWMDPQNVAGYVGVVADVLAAADPDNAELYRENAARYQEELRILDEDLQKQLAEVPEQRRILITSEAAFLYLADAYGLQHDGIWGTNAEEEGTPQQMVRILRVISENEPAALFWESTISDRYVQAVADDTGLPVKGPLYVDSLGEPGTEADSYLKLMRYNAELILEALGQ